VGWCCFVCAIIGRAHLYYPNRRHRSPALALLIAALRDRD
jgi:hypothetical protein